MSLTQRMNTLKHAHVPRVKKSLIIVDASPFQSKGFPWLSRDFSFSFIKMFTYSSKVNAAQHTVYRSFLSHSAHRI